MKNAKIAKKIAIIRKNRFLISACLMIIVIIGGCGRSDKHDLSESTTYKEDLVKEESLLIADELNIDESAALEDSVVKLHKKGCGEISNVTKLEEKKGWIYFRVVDADGNHYYLDTNKKGYFGTILTEKGYYNAGLISDNLGIVWNRNLLYSAECMEDCGCGKLESIYDVEKEKAYQFSCKDDSGAIFIITMSLDGSIGVVKTGDGDSLYEKYE